MRRVLNRARIQFPRSMVVRLGVLALAMVGSTLASHAAPAPAADIMAPFPNPSGEVRSFSTNGASPQNAFFQSLVQRARAGDRRCGGRQSSGRN